MNNKNKLGSPERLDSGAVDSAASGVKERPIPFTGTMVRAIFEGKTQTRRVMKPQPHPDFLARGLVAVTPQWPLQDGVRWFMADGMSELVRSPHGAPGERLWVREQLIRPDGDPWVYAADRQPVMVAREDETAMLVWAHHKESDYCHTWFMPRWASRITLEITGVRVERVQDISEEDAEAEGVEPWGLTEDEIADIQISDESPDTKELAKCLGPGRLSARACFQILWDEINGKRPSCAWDDNPWVWVISFRCAPDRNDRPRLAPPRPLHARA